MSIHTCGTDEICVVAECDMGWGGSRLDRMERKIKFLQDQIERIKEDKK